MIHKLSSRMPFDIRLGVVLPYVARFIEMDYSEGVSSQHEFTQSKIRVAALDVLLSLFTELFELTE